MTEKEKKYLIYLGSSIKKRRKKLRITQEIFAETIGLSRIHLSRIENGLHPVNIITLYRISKELDCSVAELIGEK